MIVLHSLHIIDRDWEHHSIIQIAKNISVSKDSIESVKKLNYCFNDVYDRFEIDA